MCPFPWGRMPVSFRLEINISQKKYDEKSHIKYINGRVTANGKNVVSGLNDFELICFLVVKEEK